jgi:hypothetical protein
VYLSDKIGEEFFDGPLQMAKDFKTHQQNHPGEPFFRKNINHQQYLGIQTYFNAHAGLDMSQPPILMSLFERTNKDHLIEEAIANPGKTYTYNEGCNMMGGRRRKRTRSRSRKYRKSRRLRRV